jgi:glycosyl transferase, family 51:penicillin-binding protein, transpeptidase
MSNMLSAVIDEGTGQRLRSVYGLHNEMAGKTGTTQNQVDGWFIGYNPQIVVGIRVGANDVNIHFNTIRLGQGANMAMPIFGRFMKDCLESPNYQVWNRLSFPFALPSQQKETEIPTFKEHLNLLEKISNRKLEKVKHPGTTEEKTKEKKGFFRRLFKKKEAK